MRMTTRILVVAGLQAEVDPMIGDRYIRKQSYGSGNGTSWGNAASLADLNAMIGAAGPNRKVYLRADEGAFEQPTSITISVGGDADQPVHIMGVNGDLVPQKVVINGTRTPWELPLSEAGAVDASAFGGNKLFVMATGCDNLKFSYLDLRKFSRLFDFTTVVADNFLFEDIDFYNIQDGIYSNQTTDVGNLVTRRFSGVGFSKKAIRFHGTSSDWLIINSNLNSGWQDKDNFAVGIECYDTAHDLLISGGYTINCRASSTEGAYWNSDGVSTERDNYNITIEDHFSAGHTDGGYDLKSELTVLNRCTSRDNKRNYRMWGGLSGTPARLNSCISQAPHKRGGSGGAHHIHLTGGDAISERGAFVVADQMVIDGTGGDIGIGLSGLDGHNASLIYSHNPVITKDATDTYHNATILASSTVLYGSGADVTAPVITADLTREQEEGDPLEFDITVSGESVVGNSTRSHVVRLKDGKDVVPGKVTGIFTLEGIKAKLSAQIFASGGDNLREADIAVYDADGNVNNSTIAVTIEELAIGDFAIIATTGAVTKFAATNTTPSFVAEMPLGVTAGNGLLCVVTCATTASVPSVSGYTLVKQHEKLSVFKKLAGGSEAAPTVSFTGATSGDLCMSQILRIAGQLNDAAFIDAFVFSTGSQAGTGTPGAITSGVANALLINTCMLNDDAASTVISVANGWEQVTNEISTTGSDGTLLIAKKEQAVAGVASMLTWDWPGSVTPRYITMSIKPAA